MKRLPLFTLLATAFASLFFTGCKQETSKAQSFSEEKILAPESAFEQTDGVIYFSDDNGLTWKNGSRGLPSITTIGLGGIAVSSNQLALMSKETGLYFYNSEEKRWVSVPTDAKLLESNAGALLFYHGDLYAATQKSGVFYSDTGGKTWSMRNTGLGNLTIRKLAEVNDKLYAATNSGLYSYNNAQSQWEAEYVKEALQVNGITALNGKMYIATNQGGFAASVGKKDWKPIFSKGALHNISAANHKLYAMAYNELYGSSDYGATWENLQSGLPIELYTFNVVTIGQTLLAGQWDGIYRKDTDTEKWQFSGEGLPKALAFANMQVYRNTVVISGNHRKLREGMTTDR